MPTGGKSRALPIPIGDSLPKDRETPFHVAFRAHDPTGPAFKAVVMMKHDVAGIIQFI